MPKPLYKQLSKLMAKDQIAEFQISFNNFNQNINFSIKEVILNLMAFTNFIKSETFLEELNKNTDKEGNVDWPSIVDKYKVEDDIDVVYI